MWCLSVLLTAAAAGIGPGPPEPSGAQVEHLRGRVWHDDTPLAEGSFRMTCVMEYLDARGTVTKTLVLEHHRSFARGGIREELLSAREDGRDVTERERRKQAEAEADRRASPSRWSVDEALSPPVPFLARGGAGYRVTTQPGGDGVLRLAYHPMSDSDTRVGEGWVDLDPADGLPVRHRFVPVPLPRMIRSLVTTVNYQRLGGMAVPASTESVGEGGLLFIRRRFRVTMRYHDWHVTAR